MKNRTLMIIEDRLYSLKDMEDDIKYITNKSMQIILNEIKESIENEKE